jgi:hypothetical protein
MNLQTLRRVPWTCEWGRFGLTAEQLTSGESRVDGVFWACRHPGLAPDIKLIVRRECETCPVWAPAARLVPDVST